MNNSRFCDPLFKQKSGKSLAGTKIFDKRKIFFSVIILALLAAGCHKSQVSDQNSQTNQPTPAAIHPSFPAPKTYTDPKTGLTFNYPPGWSVAAGSGYTLCITQDSKPKICAIGVNILPNADVSKSASNNENLIKAYKKKHTGQSYTSTPEIIGDLHIQKFVAQDGMEIFFENPKGDFNFTALPGNESTLENLILSLQIK